MMRGEGGGGEEDKELIAFWGILICRNDKVRYRVETLIQNVMLDTLLPVQCNARARLSHTMHTQTLDICPADCDYGGTKAPRGSEPTFATALLHSYSCYFSDQKLRDIGIRKCVCQCKC